MRPAKKDFGLSVIFQDIDFSQTLNSSVTFPSFQTTPTIYIRSGEDGAHIGGQQIPYFYWTAQFIAFFTLLKIDSQRFCLETGGLSLDHSPDSFYPLYAVLNPICHLLSLLGAHHILHVQFSQKSLPLWFPVVKIIFPYTF